MGWAQNRITALPWSLFSHESPSEEAESGRAASTIITSSQQLHQTSLQLMIFFQKYIIFRGRPSALASPYPGLWQVPGIGFSITVESDAGTARSLSSCTTKSPLQSCQDPSAAQRALRARGVLALLRSVLPSSSERPLSSARTLERLQRAFGGA